VAAIADPVGAVGRRVVSGYCRRALRRDVDLHVDGLEHVPPSGPAILAARHVHHLYDGCALVTTIPRPVAIMVALDWVRPGPQRQAMTWACAALGWPTIFRSDSPAATEGAERSRLLRRATRDAVALLRAGQLLLVFPEGYPNVDPHPTPKPDLDAFLPFRPGFVRLAALAERDGRTRVPIVPVGFSYQRGSRWSVTLRFDPPRYLDQEMAPADLARLVEERVRELSRP
jgi:1-acyl-sn-glycerol-3-phosphate acyltransferase